MRIAFSAASRSASPFALFNIANPSWISSMAAMLAGLPYTRIELRGRLDPDDVRAGRKPPPEKDRIAGVGGGDCNVGIAHLPKPRFWTILDSIYARARG